MHKVHITNSVLNDGSPQDFYWQDGHPNAGMFKGMARILEEHSFDVSMLKVQCKNFNCPQGSTTYCCHQILYNQSDFTDVKSNLETICRLRGFEVLFLPKFHCELSFIEQCWGYAKR